MIPVDPLVLAEALIITHRLCISSVDGNKVAVFYCKIFTLLPSFSLITVELEPDILYIKMVF